MLLKKGPRGPEWRTFLIPFDKELAKKKKFKKIKGKRYKVPSSLGLDLRSGIARASFKFKVAPVSASTETMRTMPSDDQLWDLFNAACRGDPSLRPAELDLGLSCHLLHYGDPYLRLGPFHLEEKNRAPYVAVFRDFMYEDETEAYRKAANSKLQRSRHLGKEANTEATIRRTSSQVTKQTPLPYACVYY